MNTIIIYSSKYGCTKDCANILKNKLSDNVTIVDINNNNKIELSKFDKIIIGSSIYVVKQKTSWYFPLLWLF